MSRVALASSAPGRERSKHEANNESLEETQTKTASFYNEFADFQGLVCKKSRQTHPTNKIREFTCLLHQEHRSSRIRWYIGHEKWMVFAKPLLGFAQDAWNKQVKHILPNGALMTYHGTIRKRITLDQT